MNVQEKKYRTILSVCWHPLKFWTGSFWSPD